MERFLLTKENMGEVKAKLLNFVKAKPNLFDVEWGKISSKEIANPEEQFEIDNYFDISKDKKIVLSWAYDKDDKTVCALSIGTEYRNADGRLKVGGTSYKEGSYIVIYANSIYAIKSYCTGLYEDAWEVIRYTVSKQ
jgi:hypothetical protein